MTGSTVETFIPVCEPLLEGREGEYVQDCIDGNWISSLGKYIPMFEERFSLPDGVREPGSSLGRNCNAAW